MTKAILDDANEAVSWKSLVNVIQYGEDDIM